mgnify:CR=1 FL=1
MSVLSFFGRRFVEIVVEHSTRRRIKVIKLAPFGGPCETCKGKASQEQG